MKKLKTQKQKNKVSVIALILIFSILGGYFIWKNYFRNKEVIDENTEGSAPSEEERAILDEYDRNCPMDALLLEAETNSFNAISVKCSYNELYKDIPEGEDVIVEIYTEDFEAGKQEFRNWLAEHGLAENDKLRVKYIER